MIYEAANALRFHKVYKLSSEDIFRAVKAILALKILKQLKIGSWRKTLKLSASKELSVYDAVYVALTLDLKATLITSDEKIKTKLEDQVDIVLLKDLNL